MFSIIKKERPAESALSRMREACRGLEGEIKDMKEDISYLWAILYFQDRYGVGRTSDVEEIRAYRKANARKPGGQP